MGDVCVQIAQDITSKNVQKKYGHWSEKECQDIGPIQHVILGGSIGTKGPLSLYLSKRIEDAGYSVNQAKETINNTYLGLLKHLGDQSN